MKIQKPYAAPVKGAATYRAGFDSDSGKYAVFMTDTDGYTSVIDTAQTFIIAKSRANRWQIKENEAVLKSLKP